MYFETVQQFTKMLKNLSGLLDKAILHAEARKFDPNNYLTARLAPDMFPLLRQVQIVCDNAKGAAFRLAGHDVPKQEDTEKTLSELKDRIHKTVALVESLKPEHFAGAAERRVTLPWMEGKYLLGKDYLVEFAIPNFYFHMTTAYDLLRQSGVELGKRDFLGAVSLH